MKPVSVNVVLFLGFGLAILYLAASGRLDNFVHALATGHAKAVAATIKKGKPGGG